MHSTVVHVGVVLRCSRCTRRRCWQERLIIRLVSSLRCLQATWRLVALTRSLRTTIRPLLWTTARASSAVAMATIRQVASTQHASRTWIMVVVTVELQAAGDQLALCSLAATTHNTWVYSCTAAAETAVLFSITVT